MAEESNPDWRSLGQFPFSYSPELADELAELVLAGKKRATCWAASEGPKTHAGQQWVVLDGAGVPVAVVETTTPDLALAPFDCAQNRTKLSRPRRPDADRQHSCGEDPAVALGRRCRRR